MGGLKKLWANKRDGEAFDVRTGVWHPMPLMHAERGLHALACYEM
jgi:hypothetical protein